MCKTISSSLRGLGGVRSLWLPSPAPEPFTPELASSSTEVFFWLLFSFDESLSPRLGFVSDFAVWAKAAVICLRENPPHQREGTSEKPEAREEMDSRTFN